MRFLRIFLIFSIATFVLPAFATISNSNSAITASSKSIYVASTGEVNITFLSSSASYSSDLFLVGESALLFNNKTAKPLETLTGNFVAGTELIFKLYVYNTNKTYFNGLAQRNPDHFVHSGYKVLAANSVIVGFEDLFNGGDRDYNDFIFLLNNVVVRDNFYVSAVPETDTYAILIAGLAIVGISTRRKV